jgi:putative ABC transport system permease protein
MDAISNLYRQWLRPFRTLGAFSWLWLLTLALGISVGAVCYTQLKQTVLDPFEFPNAEQLIAIKRDQGMCRDCPVSAGLWRDIDAIADLDAAGYTSLNERMSGTGLAAQKIDVAATTPNFLSMLQVPPRLGRNLRTEDADSNVAMIAEGLWRREFAADPAVIGRTIRFGEKTYQIVGVSSDRLDRLHRFDALKFSRFAEDNDGSNFLSIYARKPPGLSDVALKTSLAGALANARKRSATNYDGSDYMLNFLSMQSHRTRWLKQTLTPVLVMVSLLAFLMACNAASLFAVSVLRRMTALCTETALGASRMRLLMQVLKQSVLFTISGTLLALLIAPLLFELTRRMLPADSLSLLAVHYDPKMVLLVGTVFLLLNAIASLLPAALILRTQRLLSSDRSQVSGTGQRVGQIALAVQLVGATAVLMMSILLLRTLNRLDAVDAGFDVAPIWTAKVIWPNNTQLNDEASINQAVQKNIAFANQVIASVRQIPGVSSVAFANDIPLGEQMWNNGTVVIPGASSGNPDQPPYAQFRAIVGDYDQALGIRVVEGKLPHYRPGQEWQEVAVNQEYVDRFMKGMSPVGRTLEEWKVTVVGVLANVKQASLSKESQPDLYASLQSMHWMSQSQLIVRSAPGANGQQLSIAELYAAVREKVQAIDPSVPLFAPQSGADLRASVMSTNTLMSRIAGSFAVLALLTTALGLFGLCAYAVARRQREFGLRLAIGAAPAEVLKDVLGRSLKLGAVCAVIGCGLGILQSKLIANWMFGVASYDAWSIVLSIGVMLTLIAAASFLPAWNASRTDPMIALRSD